MSAEDLSALLNQEDHTDGEKSEMDGAHTGGETLLESTTDAVIESVPTTTTTVPGSGRGRRGRATRDSHHSAHHKSNTSTTSLASAFNNNSSMFNMMNVLDPNMSTMVNIGTPITTPMAAMLGHNPMMNGQPSYYPGYGYNNMSMYGYGGYSNSRFYPQSSTVPTSFYPTNYPTAISSTTMDPNTNGLVPTSTTDQTNTAGNTEAVTSEGNNNVTDPNATKIDSTSTAAPVSNSQIANSMVLQDSGRFKRVTIVIDVPVPNLPSNFVSTNVDETEQWITQYAESYAENFAHAYAKAMQGAYVRGYMDYMQVSTPQHYNDMVNMISPTMNYTNMVQNFAMDTANLANAQVGTTEATTNDAAENMHHATTTTLHGDTAAKLPLTVDTNAYSVNSSFSVGSNITSNVQEMRIEESPTAASVSLRSSTIHGTGLPTSMDGNQSTYIMNSHNPTDFDHLSHSVVQTPASILSPNAMTGTGHQHDKGSTVISSDNNMLVTN